MKAEHSNPVLFVCIHSRMECSLQYSSFTTVSSIVGKFQAIHLNFKCCLYQTAYSFCFPRGYHGVFSTEVRASMKTSVGPHTTKGPTEDWVCSSTESHKYLFVTAAVEPQIANILSVYILLKVSLNSPTTGIKY